MGPSPSPPSYCAMYIRKECYAGRRPTAKKCNPLKNKKKNRAKEGSNIQRITDSETSRQGENRMGKANTWTAGHFGGGTVPLALFVSAIRGSPPA
jgi:hypothetical protein